MGSGITFSKTLGYGIKISKNLGIGDQNFETFWDQGSKTWQKIRDQSHHNIPYHIIQSKDSKSQIMNKYYKKANIYFGKLNAVTVA